jgi:hypothetical protein
MEEGKERMAKRNDGIEDGKEEMEEEKRGRKRKREDGRALKERMEEKGRNGWIKIRMGKKRE